MQKQISGIYYSPKCNQSVSAILTQYSEKVTLNSITGNLLTCNISNLEISSPIPGVALEINFENGAKFIANNSTDRLNIGSDFLERLEKNYKFVIASLVLVPFIAYLLIFIVMPKVAAHSVTLMPNSLAQSVGSQTLYILKKSVLAESRLSPSRQQRLANRWEETLQQLDLSALKYQLKVFSSDYFGANAFALPNGVVVVTDDLLNLLNLLNLLEDKPDALLAILLHEIGHVEGKHSMRMIAQSISSTITLHLLIGDMEGIGEAILGTSSAIAQNAFSRDMEREADQYAFKQLERLGKSSQHFSQAMKSLQANLSTSQQQEKTGILRYLSTHPQTQERIKNADAFNKEE